MDALVVAAVEQIEQRGFAVVDVDADGLPELSAAILQAHSVVRDFYDDRVTPSALRDLVRLGAVPSAPTAGLVSSTRRQHAIVKLPASGEVNSQDDTAAAYAQWTQQVHSYQLTATAMHGGVSEQRHGSCDAFPWPVSPPSFSADLRNYMANVQEVLRAVAVGLFGPGADDADADDVTFARAVTPARYSNVVALSAEEAASLQQGDSADAPVSDAVARVRSACKADEEQPFDSAHERVGSHTDSGVLTAIPVLVDTNDNVSQRPNVSGLQVRCGDAWVSALDVHAGSARPMARPLASAVRLFVMLGEEGAAICSAMRDVPPLRVPLTAAVHRVAPDVASTVAAVGEAVSAKASDCFTAERDAANRITLPYQLRGWRPAALPALDARKSRVTARSLVL